MKIQLSFVISIVIALFVGLSDAMAGESAPELVPQPKNLKMGEGALALTRDSRIVATSKELGPLATLLADEIQRASGIELSALEGTSDRAAQSRDHGEPVNILLRLDPALHGEAYTLDAKGSVVVQGGNYQAVAYGTATLLQLLRAENGALSLPSLHIDDEPAYAYRGALIDLGRKYHSPDGIEQVIELCRLYKIRYLQLHLTDDQLFMFPSTKFPQLGKSNREFARFEPGSKPVNHTLHHRRASRAGTIR